jgi:divalent metal cation (Fe/Co/Zn/Cd) transporter
VSSDTPDVNTPTTEEHRALLRRARAVSIVSLCWTVAASTGALVIGLSADSLVLVAFAFVGAFDSVGSGGLVVHFGRALRDGTVSEHLERVVLTLVAFGLWAVAAGTAVQSVLRLASDETVDAPTAGTVLALASTVVLTVLARRKASIGRALPSAALVADGQLTRFGAVLSFITLLGTASASAFGWSWLDPVAALLVAAGMVVVGRSVFRESRRLPPSET